MNILAFFVLAVTLISVVCAQQQSNDTAQQTYEVINQSSQQNLDADIFVNATLTLKDAFIRGTNFIEQSEKTINDVVSEAGQSTDNPEAAKEIIEKGFKLANQQIAQAVPVFFPCFGEALALSNNGAEQDLRKASVLLQKAGLSIIEQLQIAQNLFNFGIDAKDFAAKILIQAVRLTVETGYTGFYHNAQESIKTADKALRDADQAGPNAQGVPDTNCGAAQEDSQGGSDAVKEINQAANDALARGADSNLVEEFKNTVICALGDVAVFTKEGGNTVHSLLPLAESDPKAAEEKYDTTIKTVKEGAHKATAQIFVAIGDAALKSKKESNPEIKQAINDLENGKIEIIRSVDAGGEILVVGLRYKGDTPSKTIDAVARTGYYAKVAFLQGIVKAAKLVLSVI